MPTGKLYRKLATFKRSARILFELHGRHERECPICNKRSFFAGVGSPVRFDAQCLSCGSLERHRQHFLLVQNNWSWIAGALVLHIAAEDCFLEAYKRNCKLYVRGDYVPKRGALKIGIQDMTFEDGSFDTLICHQVLEHVEDDRSALAEIYRVLRPGGRAIMSTPIVQSWPTTYENRSVSSPQGRDLFFGQVDHVRFYGADFRSFLETAGFKILEDVACEPSVSRFGLVRGDLIFVAQKPSLVHDDLLFE